MRTPLSFQRGTSLIEVLVTVVILAFGLLGLVGMITKLQGSSMEAYQRSQALILVQDMANRIESNRNLAASYVTGTGDPLGAGMQCPASDATDLQLRDAGEWCQALQGAGEVQGTKNQGAMIGGRGCVESLGNGEYMVTVAWQGLGPAVAPPATVACGAGLYNGAAGSGSACTNDRCRRAVTTIVRIASLT